MHNIKQFSSYFRSWTILNSDHLTIKSIVTESDAAQPGENNRRLWSLRMRRRSECAGVTDVEAGALSRNAIPALRYTRLLDRLSVSPGLCARYCIAEQLGGMEIKV